MFGVVLARNKFFGRPYFEGRNFLTTNFVNFYHKVVE